MRKYNVVKQKIDTSVWGIVIICITVIALFWRCSYGYISMDEGFYPTIVYRFLQGDAILYEEWSNVQLAAVPVLPIMKIYLLLIGSTDGIYLFIRYAYTTFQVIISILLYLRLKDYGKKLAFITAYLYMIFANYGLMVLSYNTLAFSGMAITCMFLFSHDKGMKSNIYALFAGIGLSISVLGIPHIALIYILYAIVVLVININDIGKKIQSNVIRSFYSIKSFVWLTTGIIICIVLFGIYVLGHTSIEQVVRTIPYILYSDTEHPARTLFGNTIGFIIKILIGNRRNYVTFLIYMLMGVDLLLYFKDIDKKNNFANYLIVESILTIILFCVYVTTDNFINVVIFVPNVLAFFVFLMVHNEKIKEFFFCFWLPGMVVMYCEYVASNTGFIGMAGSSYVATIGSTMMILIAAKQCANNQMLRKLLYLSLVCVTIGCVWYRVGTVFFENTEMEKISCGTAKGLIVKEKEYKRYMDIYQDTNSIRSMNQNNKVLYIADQVLWMAGKQRFGSYSTWLYSIEEDRSLLYAYYEEHPDKIPDAMYIEDFYNMELVKELAQKFNYHYVRKKAGWLIQKN